VTSLEAVMVVVAVVTTRPVCELSGLGRRLYDIPTTAGGSYSII
jgi:hypothetical protein